MICRKLDCKHGCMCGWFHFITAVCSKKQSKPHTQGRLVPNPILLMYTSSLTSRDSSVGRVGSLVPRFSPLCSGKSLGRRLKTEQLALPLRGSEAGASGRIPAPWQRAVNGQGAADSGQERGPSPHLHGCKGAATQASCSIPPWH